MDNVLGNGLTTQQTPFTHGCFLLAFRQIMFISLLVMKGTQACLFLERAFDKSRGQYMKGPLHEGHSASAYTHVARAVFCFVLFCLS